MTPLQSNKAAPNKNNNKKKINSPHITKKNRQFLILSGIFSSEKFCMENLFKPHAYTKYTKIIYKIKQANKK